MLVLFKDEKNLDAAVVADAIMIDHHSGELYIVTSVGNFYWAAPLELAESYIWSAWECGKVSIKCLGMARYEEV